MNIMFHENINQIGQEKNKKNLHIENNSDLFKLYHWFEFPMCLSLLVLQRKKKPIVVNRIISLMILTILSGILFPIELFNFFSTYLI